jgi:hypothetical protein
MCSYVRVFLIIIATMLLPLREGLCSDISIPTLTLGALSGGSTTVERCDGNEKDSIHGNKVDVCA